MPDEPKSAVLYDWSLLAEALWLESGGSRVRLRLDPEQLPLTKSNSPLRPERIGDGAAVRLSKTVGYLFAGKERMLPLDWEPSRNIRPGLERSYLADRAPLVVVGELTRDGDGPPTLVVRAGDGSVLSGTMDGLRAAGQEQAKTEGIAWLPFLIGGAWLVRSALRKRRELVVQSNRTD